MCYWLMKSEPTSYSIDHLAKAPRQTTGWDGVRNYQVRNMLRDEMKTGNLAFFYHSSCPEPGIFGMIEIVKEGYPDPTAFDPKDHHYDPDSDPTDPRWYQVDVKLVERFQRPISLVQLRQNPRLQEMLLLRKGNRLSITPLTVGEWKAVLAMR